MTKEHERLKEPYQQYLDQKTSKYRCPYCPRRFKSIVGIWRHGQIEQVKKLLKKGK